ncbi:unnamed protein product, partial [marine sediment metagenome]
MSRIGQKPIAVPSGVKIELKDHSIKASGPKGELSWKYPDEIAVEFEESSLQIRVTRSSDESRIKALHGLTRALIANMVHGVQEEYEKKLEIYGTGYSCNLKGNRLLLNVGFVGRGIDAKGKAKEAQFIIDIPKGLTATVVTAAARGDTEPAKL